MTFRTGMVGLIALAIFVAVLVLIYFAWAFFSALASRSDIEHLAGFEL